MIILGLHGWKGTHDAAAALIIDGEVIACMEEERLSRRKHAVSDTPLLAAHAVLHQAGIGWDDVDVVAYGWDLPGYLAGMGRPWPFQGDREFLTSTFQIDGLGRCPAVQWVDHHAAHAACAFYSSPFARAAVLVVDGQGEDRSISLFSGDRDAGLRLVRDWEPSCSLGLMYEAATKHCGFGFLEAGKTMGLSAFGGRSADPLPIAWADDEILSPIARGLREDAVTDAWSRIFVDRFGAPVRPGRRFDPVAGRLRWARDDTAPHYPDVAAAAQEAVERMLFALVDHARRATGQGNVVLAGGVALNCVANGLLLDQCDALFVPPTAHDAGAALGAAMWVAAQANEPLRAPDGARLGLEFSPDDIQAVLDEANLGYRRTDDPAREAAERIERGEILGWFQGRTEIGPRALGGRSILGSPLPAGNRDRVNRIKGREPWRPLAPSALAADTRWMFGRDIDSPFMLQSLTLTDDAARRIPAVAHVDGSTRVQTVRPDPDDPYARMLAELGRRTGTSVVLNTSFNAGFEPIVCTPADAIRTFSAMGLDTLILGDFVLTK